MITTEHATSGSQFLNELFGLVEDTDFIEVSDEDDTEKMQSVFSLREGEIYCWYTTARVDYGEMSYRLHFRRKDGSTANCSGGTISPRYVAGGNGTYLPGVPGVHWDEEKIATCRVFLSQQ